MERGNVRRCELLHWTTNDLLTDAGESLPGQVDSGIVDGMLWYFIISHDSMMLMVGLFYKNVNYRL